MPPDRPQPDRPPRDFLYARVSSRDQGERGTSLEEQQEDGTSSCLREGLPPPLVRVEVEGGGEEKIERRDVMRALLAEVKPGDRISVTRVDRWSRDVVFTLDTVRKLVKRGIRWRSIGDSIDATTEAGDAALGYLALAADHEHKRIRRRTAGAKIRLLKMGLWSNGAVPFGYRRGPREQKRQLYLEVVEEDARLVRLAFDLAIKGKSFDAIREELQMERPDRSWQQTVIRNILKNRAYVGEVLAAGVWVPGQHPAIVDLGVFTRAQTARHARWNGGARNDPNSRTASWLVRGMTWCALCGARMKSAYGRKALMGWESAYLGCRAICGARYVRVEVVDAEVAGLVLDRLSDLRFELGGKVPKAPAKVPDRQAVRERIEKRRARAVKAYLDEVITAQELAAERGRLDAELAKLETQAVGAAERAAAQDPKARVALLSDLAQLERAWTVASVEIRRAILARLAVRILVEQGEPSRVEWRDLPALLAINHL